MSSLFEQMTQGQSFAFVGTLIEPTLDLPYEVMPGHTLKRADARQVERIKEAISRHLILMPMLNPYEMEFVSGKPIKHLPQEEWRYYVIEFLGTNAPMHDYARASLLSKVELYCGPQFIGDHGVTYNALGDSAQFGGALPRPLLRVGTEDFDDIRATLNVMLEVEEKYSDIKRAIGMYQQVTHLVDRSNLAVLGLFAVIESILTHNPKDTYDSLGHQIRNKVALLSNRLSEPIDYAQFGNTKPDKVWNTLYDYRSRVAHGGEFDFEKSLKLLKNSRDANAFLKSVTKALLRHALDEPQLYMDLKEC